MIWNMTKKDRHAPRLAWPLILCGAMVIGLTTLSDRGAARAGEPMSLEAYRQARKQLAHKPRRLIWNQDGGDARVGREGMETPEDLLALRTKRVADSHVEMIAYCTGPGFGMYSHRTEVAQVFNVRAGVYRHNFTQRLIEQGTDPLQVHVEFARKHGKEIIWAMRMNDTHDATNEHALSRFKKDNPDALFDPQQGNPEFGKWSAVDYGNQKVRDTAVRIIEEVVTNYDVDGVELNFNRHCIYFKKASRGERLTQADRDQLTDMVRRVRQVTEDVGRKRGRPLLLVVQTPDSIEYCRSIGIDLERWLAEGLIDLYVATNYFRLNPWEYSVDLGHKYDVPVFANLSETRVREWSQWSPDTGWGPEHIPAYRGRALQARHAGIDGIYLFNYNVASSPLYSELGDPELLKRLDRAYYVTARGYGRPAGRITSPRPYSNIPILTPRSPIRMDAAGQSSIDIVVGEDLDAGHRAGLVDSTVCRLWFKGIDDPSMISVRLNDTDLSNPSIKEGWVSFPVDPATTREGTNTVTVRLHRTPDQTVLWKDLLISVTAAKR